MRKLTVTLSAAFLTMGVCAPAVPALAATSGRAAASVVAPGTIVLPPAPNEEPMPVSGLLGSTGGVSFVLQDGTENPPVQYRAFGSSSRVSSGLSPRSEMSLVGNQLVVMHDANPGYQATAVDITSGARTDLASYQTTNANIPNYFVTGTGDGWLDVIYNSFDGTYTLTRHVTGGGSTALITVSPGSWLFAHADSNGVVLGDLDGVTNKMSDLYIDFATRHATVLEAPAAGSSWVALSPGFAAVASNGVIKRWSRSQPDAAPTSRPVGYTAESLAITDTATAWVERAAYNQAGDYINHIYSAVGSGTAKEVAGASSQLASVTAIDSGDFAGLFGDAATTRAIRRFAPGSTAAGTVIEATGASAPLSVDAGPGRLTYAIGDGQSSPQLYTHNVVRSGTTLSAPGTSQPVNSNIMPNTPVAFSGGHTAHLEYGSPGNCFAVVDDGATEIARVHASNSCEGVGLSGQRLLIESSAPDGQSYGSGLLVDLNTGATSVEPETTAIFGNELAYMRRDGAVLLRDLSHPGSPDTVIRAPGIPAGADLIGGGRSIVQLHGDWLLWGSTSEGSMAELKAQHLTDLSAPPVDLTAPIDEAVLGDGIVATLSATDSTVSVHQLSDGTSSIIGTSRPRTANRRWLTMTDEYVAFVADDATTHLVPFDQIPDAGPRTLGVVAPAAMPAGATYAPAIDASRPLDSWTFTVKDANGATVSQQTGTAGNGGARPTWNGRTSGGSVAAAGSYFWTMTGTGPGGTLKAADGSGTPIAGQVNVVNGDAYQPVPQARVYASGSTPLVANADREIQVSGRGGVPAGADAVLINVEVSNPSAAGYLRVTPGGMSSSTAVQEFAKGQTISNLVAVKLSSTGTIRLHLSAGSAAVFADVAGYYSNRAPDFYQPVPQARVYGSGAPALVANTDREIQISGQGGVPAGADAVLVNVEVSNPSAAGYLRVTPGGMNSSTAVQEFAKGQTVSNLVAVKLSPSGTIRLHLSAGQAAVFADVAGYYTSSSSDAFQPLPQARVYGSGAPALVANSDREIQVSGRGGVPAGADAVLINVEVANPSAAGYLRVTPGGMNSSTAVQEFAKGQTVSNLVAVKLSPSGTIRLHLSAGQAAVFADVAGYYKH